ncbi:MAG: GNAT family N-acetyltransferase [Minicystis sp.]
MRLDVPPGTLETERLRLEPAVAAHAAQIIDDLRDAPLYRFMAGGRLPRLRELRAELRRLQIGARDGGVMSLAWVAEGRAERRYVGFFEAEIAGDGRASLGYLIFSRFWRRGYALEACRRILRHLFEDRGVEVVIVDTVMENTAARALAARLGFRSAGDNGASADDRPEEGLIRHVLWRPSRHAGASEMVRWD